MREKLQSRIVINKVSNKKQSFLIFFNYNGLPQNNSQQYRILERNCFLTYNIKLFVPYICMQIMKILVSNENIVVFII